ncbi:carbohydrate ABC transporter permease [Mycolicibacterium arenosum]|uniref:Carbohydrate ABC transporter permease n=1 Tax=Mycolicibacterium arenosum TaxID=2952157 RepID=A0ABT1MCG1_9MYCO|nr:carbohydrate ABC transporter permease [Mycolicibacterium sp. CAU 1645]MCP9276560.1 carbohydrate ABC transporter permease [Mycolicibacterium sp. CAU 1645]
MLRWLLVAVAVTASLFPFYWMMRTSLAPTDEIFFAGIDPLPSSLTLDNYVRAWNEAHLGRAMLNGGVVVLGILALQLFTCIPAAYAFAKLRFPARNLLYGLMLVALLVPTQARAVPMFLALSQLDLVNTLASLIVPFATSAFGLFLIRQYIVTIPDALLEAARMDGLGHLSILFKLIIPLARPAILTFVLFSVFAHWNDYLWPLLVARDPGLYTPPLALAVFQNAELGIDYGALTAAAAMITVPVLVLFLFVRRRFVAGLSGGELVG